MEPLGRVGGPLRGHAHPLIWYFADEAVASLRGHDAGDAQRDVPRPRRRGHVPAALRRQAGVVRRARRAAHVRARRGALRARRARRAVLRHRARARRARRPQARQGRLRRAGRRRTFIGDIAAFTGEPTISACVAVEPTDVIAFDRAGLRDMLARWPEFGEHIFRTLLARRAWHEAEGHGIMRLIARARLAARVRGARPARAQPAAGPLVRRRHRRRERRDARLARHPARGDAGAGARHQRHAQPLRRAGRAVAGPARRGRRRALRPRRARRRAGRAGGRRLRRLGGAADVRRRGLGAGRPGRDEHADRELPRLPERDLGHRADAQGDAAGAPLRRGAVELPPRGRARRRARGPRPRRPRRRPARAGPLAS